MKKGQSEKMFRKPGSGRFRSLLLMLFVFICGGVAGGGLAVKIIVTHVQDAVQGKAGPAEKFTKRLTRALDLSDAQSVQVTEIVQRNLAELRPLRSEVRSTLLTQIDNARKEMETILTPEQGEKLEKRLKKIRGRWFSSQPPTLTPLP